MKKNQKRKLIVALFSAALLCSTFGVVKANTVAEEVEPKDFTAISFAMEEGASVNISGEGGIRFNAQMTRADYDSIEAYYDTLSYGAFILPAAYNTAERDITNWENFFGANPKFDWEGDVAEGTLPALKTNSLIFENEDGLMQVNGSVVGIHDKHLYMDYVGVCYVQGEVNGKVEYKFATLDEDQERNMVYVAQKAIESGKYKEYETTLNDYINDYITWYKSKNDNAVPTVEYTVESYYNGVKTTEVKSAPLNSKVSVDTDDLEEGITVKTAESTLSGTAYAGGKLVLKAVYDVDMSADVSMTRTDANGLQLTITAAAGNVLYVNDAVVSNPYTMTITQDTTYTYQTKRSAPVELTSEKVTKYVGANAFKTTDEKVYMLEDFSSEESLTNTTNVAGLPYNRWEPMASSTVSYTTSFSNAYSSVNGAMTVAVAVESWVQWSGATYNFPVSVPASEYDKLALKVTYPDWGNSQYMLQYVGLVVDGKLTGIDLTKYVTGQKHTANNTRGVEYAAEKAVHFWDESKGGTSCLGIDIYINLQKYLADHPTISSIDGVFMGAASGNAILKTWHIDEIWLENEPDALDYDYSSLNDLDASTITFLHSGIEGGLVADETATDGYAFKIGFPGSATWKESRIYLGDVLISEYSSIKIRYRSSGTIHFYFKGATDEALGGKEFLPASATYTEFDLLSVVKNVTDTSVFNYIKCQNGSGDAAIYIDSITFVKK